MRLREASLGCLLQLFQYDTQRPGHCLLHLSGPFDSSWVTAGANSRYTSLSTVQHQSETPTYLVTLFYTGLARLSPA
jgi:hypothetical protein